MGRRVRYRVLSFLAVTSLTMAGCSSPTTMSEWSCPSDQPDGCYDVASADRQALDVLKAGNTRPGQAGNVTVSRVALPKPISISSTPETYFDTDGWPLRADEDAGDADTVDVAGHPPSRPHISSKPRGRHDSDLVTAVPDTTPDTDMAVLPDAAAVAMTSDADTPSSPKLVPVSKVDRVRVPEQLAEIWIGPFEDTEGNYHPASRLFIVVRPAMWRR